VIVHAIKDLLNLDLYAYLIVHLHKYIIQLLENANAILVTINHLINNVLLDVNKMNNGMEINVFAKVDLGYLKIYVQNAQQIPQEVLQELAVYVIYQTIFLIKILLSVKLALLILIIQKMIPNVFVMMVLNKLEILAHQFVSLMNNLILKQIIVNANMDL